MEKQTLQVKLRTLRGRKVSKLRAVDTIPAVVYGTTLAEPKSIELNRIAFNRVYNEAGTSGLVELQIEGGDTIPVIIQEYQVHPLTDYVRHVDFLAVNLKKEVEATVRLEFVGEAPAVKVLGGMLVTNMEELDVRGLPTALVSYIDVDVSVLKTFDDMIRVSDIVLPEGLRVEEELLEQSIVGVAAPRDEKELEALNEEVVEDVSAIEGVEKKETEDAEEEENKK